MPSFIMKKCIQPLPHFTVGMHNMHDAGDFLFFLFFFFFFFFAAGYRCLAVIANSSFAVHIHLSIHPSIHPLSTTYPGSSHGGSRLRRVFQTSFSPATLHRVSSQLVMPGTPFKGGAQEAS